MAALCFFLQQELNTEEEKMLSLAELWTEINLARWDSKRKDTAKLLNSHCAVAIIQLAAVVLGLPFPDKINRLAWCKKWSTLLLTWGVARGFVADTGMRPPRAQN